MRTLDDYFRDVIPRVYTPVMRELLTREELGTVNVSIREFPDGSPRRATFQSESTIGRCFLRFTARRCSSR